MELDDHGVKDLLCSILEMAAHDWDKCHSTELIRFFHDPAVDTILAAVGSKFDADVMREKLGVK